ncbi:hypothetical protein NC651_038246 [Populus alba x Populus x berolinensis]|nr:hypothetical protein NC651_038246 [Populus alba x Populus x berolinensis]
MILYLQSIDYDLYKFITSMFTRMITITNNLDTFSRTYTNFYIMRKILRSLPKTLKAKVMTIREAKDLTEFSLEEIIRSLIDANLVITWSRNPHTKTSIPGKPSKSGLIGV